MGQEKMLLVDNGSYQGAAHGFAAARLGSIIDRAIRFLHGSLQGCGYILTGLAAQVERIVKDLYRQLCGLSSFRLAPNTIGNGIKCAQRTHIGPCCGEVGIFIHLAWTSVGRRAGY
jgi:hypothetical protein